jgi:hypothetical protein
VDQRRVEVETAPSSRPDDEASCGKSYVKNSTANPLSKLQKFVGVSLPLIYHTTIKGY